MPPEGAGAAAADAVDEALAGVCRRALNSHRPVLIPVTARPRPPRWRAAGGGNAPILAMPASPENEGGAGAGIAAACSKAVERGAGTAAGRSAGAMAAEGGGKPAVGFAVFSGSAGRTGVIGFSAQAGATAATTPASIPPATMIITCRGRIVSPRIAEPATALPSGPQQHHARRRTGFRLYSTAAPGLGSSHALTRAERYKPIGMLDRVAPLCYRGMGRSPNGAIRAWCARSWTAAAKQLPRRT